MFKLSRQVHFRQCNEACGWSVSVVCLGKVTNMILRTVFYLCCGFCLVQSRPFDDAWKNERDNVIDWLLQEKIRENEERNGNLHGHIVRVNEAHQQSRMEDADEVPLEEQITTVNEDANKQPGCQLFEGDLCLDPEDQAVVSHMIHEEDLKRNVIRNSKKLWPQKTVYYYVDHNLQHLRPKINDAINRLEVKTCLTFREVGLSYGGDYIKMHKGNGCFSKMGRVGGAQLLSLGSGCGYVGVIMHELMHSIGIWHEQSRMDRDKYVEVLWSNIEPGKENNFLKYEHGKLDTLNLPYDYDSIMHYDRYLYSVDGKRPTIIARGKAWKKLGGQLRGTLTGNDIKEIRALYNC
ncbi:zinc metalloproteinase nas-4-like isoform X2 [Orbicella faveolata]|uniref:zinc metalloproteinase nas-4-like isoform X2 n=1 Tax=Orbicella faveolata TaxID=48498 RepID=UPI0009E30DB3|nr:zinc metalloproteinase nas-4-like isoform X2 [Orbicella faveolata]